MYQPKQHNSNGEKNYKNGALATKLENQTKQCGMDDIPIRKLFLTRRRDRPIKSLVSDRFFNDNSFHADFSISWESYDNKFAIYELTSLFSVGNRYQTVFSTFW